MIIRSFIFLCLLSVSPALGQQSVADSLLRIIPALPDTQKISTYFDICRELVGNDKEGALDAANKALSIARQTGEPRWIARAMNVMVASLHIHGEMKAAYEMAQSAVEYAEKSNNNITLLESYGLLSNAYGLHSEWDKALVYGDKSRQVAEAIKDTLGMLDAYSIIAVCQMELKNFAEARALNELCIKLSQLAGREYEYGRAEVNLGENHFREKNWDQAILHTEIGANVFSKMNYDVGVVQAQAILANAYYELGDLTKSKETSEQMLHILGSSLNDPLAGEAFKVLGLVALDQLDYEVAAKHFQQTVQLAQLDNNYKTLKVAYRGLETIYLVKGDLENSRKYKNLFEATADSIFSENALRNISEYQVKYETALKDQQIFKERQRRNQWVLGSAFAMLLFVGYFFIVRNQQMHLHKETQMQAALEHAEAERLADVNRIKSIFFTNISHEFRTPLTLITSPLQQLLKGDLKGDVRKYYEAMLRNAERLLLLVNQLLDLSKLESGKLQLHTETGDLNKFLQIIINSFESLASRKNSLIELRAPEETLHVKFDQDKLEKILNNLISNAIKFCDDNSTIFVELDWNDREKSIFLIRVTDQGLIIPAEDLPDIFNRFGQTVISEIQPGSGIGLALTKELVELHGGEIGVKSMEGGQTCFSFTFKAEPADPSEELRVYAPVHSTTHSVNEKIVPDAKPADGSLKVLVAEDNEELRNYLHSILHPKYEVILARNGKEALKLTQEIIPDLVISDIMMPEMDGKTFCRLIKTQEPTSHIPVILLTALAETEDKLSGLKTGADDYLLKPFHHEELTTRINNLLERTDRQKKYFIRQLLAMKPREVKAENPDEVFLSRVKLIIDENLEDETFSVVELAKMIGYSRSQLHRKLSALIDQAPNELIRNFRLERSRQLLKQHAGTVSEIAYRCGFNSPAYFIKCYKDKFGTTPLATE
ncbi:MAG: response regulator [Saprospiraceae bacterium]